MPRNLERKGGRRNAQLNISTSEIRLTDFAHAILPSVDSARLSKPVVAATKALLRCDKDWFDCELDEFLVDLDDDSRNDKDLNDCDYQKTALHSVKANKRNNEFSGLGEYPDDLWHILSEYLQPEAVGKFACLCSATAQIVQTAGFWKRMYLRYYREVPDLHEKYKPSAMHRLYGLRTCVIKALHHMYAPFVDRAKLSSVSLSPETHHIVKLCRGRCAATWHEAQEPANGNGTVHRSHTYFIKFQGSTGFNANELLGVATNSGDSSTSSKEDSNPWHVRSNRFAMLSNIWANSQAGTCVLKIVCSNFVVVPNVIGWRLHELSTSLGQDFCTQRLKLSFVNAGVSYRSNYQSASKSGRSAKHPNSHSVPCNVVIFEGISQVQILDWWHPNFPIDVV